MEFAVVTKSELVEQSNKTMAPVFTTGPLTRALNRPQHSNAGAWPLQAQRQTVKRCTDKDQSKLQTENRQAWRRSNMGIEQKDGRLSAF